jgi:ABC-type Fe3+-siderophore transport system permease subunit
MVVAIETLFLTALISAFIGLVALFAIASPTARGSSRLRQYLLGVTVAATIVSLTSYVLYALTPHEETRQTVYMGSR